MIHLLSVALGAFLMGSGAMALLFRLKTGGIAKLSQTIIEEANRKSATLQISLKKKELEHSAILQQKSNEVETKLIAKQERFKLREEEWLKEKREVEEEKKRLQKEKQVVSEKKHQATVALEKITGLSKLEAMDQLRAENNQQLEKERLIEKEAFLKEIEASGKKEAQKIIAQSISQVAVSTASELTVTTLTLPSDEMKGRIIGKEGRNIRALEQATGVNFLVDESPGVVVISGFDPYRKEIAKLALKALVKDGRIHPTRIEECVVQAKKDIEMEKTRQAQKAMQKVGISNLHPTLIEGLGRLYFRYSFSQNVLAHSVEVALLLGQMAAELGLDAALGRRMGLLHDIGKTLDNPEGLSHALLGHQVALECHESSVVANGIGCHHGEIDPTSIEASLCSAADAISGARPGARMEAVEQSVKRLCDLENLTKEFKGVESAYALQAGREVRVVVTPNLYDDAATNNLARAMAKEIEAKLNYPGKIKVTVIREVRATEYAN